MVNDKENGKSGMDKVDANSDNIIKFPSIKGDKIFKEYLKGRSKKKAEKKKEKSYYIDLSDAHFEMIDTGLNQDKDVFSQNLKYKDGKIVSSGNIENDEFSSQEVLIPLNKRTNLKDLNLELVEDEFASKYLEKIGVDATRYNIRKILEIVPINKCDITYKKGSGMAEKLFISIKPRYINQENLNRFKRSQKIKKFKKGGKKIKEKKRINKITKAKTPIQKKRKKNKRSALFPKNTEQNSHLNKAYYQKLLTTKSFTKNIKEILTTDSTDFVPKKKKKKSDFKKKISQDDAKIQNMKSVFNSKEGKGKKISKEKIKYKIQNKEKLERVSKKLRKFNSYKEEYLHPFFLETSKNMNLKNSIYYLVYKERFKLLPRVQKGHEDNKNESTSQGINGLLLAGTEISIEKEEIETSKEVIVEELSLFVNSSKKFVRSIQKQFLLEFPFHKLTKKISKEKYRQKIMSSTITSFVLVFSKFCYWRFLGEFGGIEEYDYDNKKEFINIFETIVSNFSHKKDYSSAKKNCLPVEILCIKVCVETIFRTYYENFFRTDLSTNFLIRMNYMFTFLVDPHYYFSGIENFKTKNLEFTYEDLKYYKTSPFLKMMLGKPQSIQARNLFRNEVNRLVQREDKKQKGEIKKEKELYNMIFGNEILGDPKLKARIISIILNK